MVEKTPDGILLLGGDRNGLNFEIEYYDDLGTFHEAVFSIAHHMSDKAICNASPALRGSLVFRLSDRLYCIPLPGGCRELIAFRRPFAIGGEDITGFFA